MLVKYTKEMIIEVPDMKQAEYVVYNRGNPYLPDRLEIAACVVEESEKYEEKL